MTTAPALSVPTVEIHTIRQHPANPRRTAVADDSMVDSIATVGLYDPLMVAPDPENAGGWILIDGHRRLDGCHKAGLTEVPVNPRHDLVTEAQQMEVMVITGLQKEKLSPVEEAAAYEQLALAGMDVADIAASTGFSKKRVQSRLKLNTLSVEARDHLYLGEATLEDAEALLEFADDPETTERLDGLLGSHNFKWEVQTARSARDRRARNQAVIDEYAALGATEADLNGAKMLRSFHKESLGEPAGHKGCLGWLGDIDSYSEPYLVCTKPSKHKDTTFTTRDVPEPEISEWEKKREERAAAQAAAVAANAARLDFLRDHLTGLFPTKGNGPLAGLSKTLVPLLILDDRGIVDDGTLLTAYEVPVAPGSSYDAIQDTKGALAAGFTAAANGKALGGLALYLAVMIAEQLGNDPEYAHDAAQVEHQLNLWDWFAAAGYVLSDHDLADRAALEARLTELGAD